MTIAAGVLLFTVTSIVLLVYLVRKYKTSEPKTKTKCCPLSKDASIIILITLFWVGSLAEIIGNVLYLNWLTLDNILLPAIDTSVEFDMYPQLTLSYIGSFIF